MLLEKSTVNDSLVSTDSHVPIDSIVPPTNVAFKKGEADVTVTWKNGALSTISGHELRRYCACSECRARKVVGISLINVSSELAEVSLMGRNALHVKFSDGHERGIYPWPYLYAISQGRGMEYLSE
ncbi:MAG: DUF971 family protein [Oleiphilaceae bacterium]